MWGMQVGKMDMSAWQAHDPHMSFRNDMRSFRANLAAPGLAGTVPAAPTAPSAACLVWRPSRRATGLVRLAWRRVWSSRSLWIWWRRAWRHVRRRLQVCVHCYMHSVLQGGQLRPLLPHPPPTIPFLPLHPYCFISLSTWLGACRWPMCTCTLSFLEGEECGPMRLTFDGRNGHGSGAGLPQAPHQNLYSSAGGQQYF